MDNQCLVVLSKFSVAARKVIGAVNPAKLLRDRTYSADVFQKVDAMGDEELILLSLDLQNMLGLLDISTIKDLASAEKKYMFGARS